MKQQKSGVKWSLSTKLLLSVMAILSLTVAFLTVSSIVLLKRDKTAYVFDAQATACALAGREFAAYAQSTLDVVRHAILLVDPFQPLNEFSARNVQAILDNQSVALVVQVGRYRPGSDEFVPVVRAVKADALRALGLFDADLALSPLTLKAYSRVLATRGSAFVNLSQVGKPPLLGVLLVDRKSVNGSEVGLSFGLVSLHSFQSGIPPSVGSLAIFNGMGDVLFHTDSSVLVANSTVRESGQGAGPQDPMYQEARASKANAGAREITLGGTRYLASYFKPGLDTVVSTRAEYEQAMRATYTLTEKLLFFGILSIALAIIMAVFFAKSLTRPILRISEATKEVAQGNFEINIPVGSQDEVGALARAVNTMSRKIAELVQKMKDQARVEQELAVASTVQANLFPLPTYGDHQIRLKGFYQSASECGGDWWGFFRVGGKMAIVIADATGHGIPSALMTAAIRGCFSTLHKLFRSRPDLLQLTPREIIPIANAAVFESGRSGINMTFFIGIIDFDRKVMTYANAAHCPPWLLQHTPGKPAKARLLMSAGPRLGESPEIGEVQEHEVALQPNDMIIFYTDGWLEGKNPEGVMYGKKRTRKIIESNFGRGEEFMINAIVKDFMEYNGDKALDDDLTLVAATITADAFKFGGGGAAAAPPKPA